MGHPRLDHLPDVGDQTPDVPQGPGDAPSVRIGIIPDPQTGGYLAPAFQVRPRPPVVFVSPRLAEIVVDGREDRDQVVRKSVDPGGRDLCLILAVDQKRDFIFRKFLLHLVGKFDQIEEIGGAGSLVLLLQRRTLRTMAELARRIVGGDGKNLPSAAPFPFPVHVLQNVGRQLLF